MSGNVKSLPVVYAAMALNELVEIWEWNEKTYDRQHAAEYIDFLIEHTQALGKHPQMGRSVIARPDLRYLPIKVRNRGHGHVAVYTADQQAVNILHIFHSAQNWQSKLVAN